MAAYRLVTTWRLETDRRAVWHALNTPDAYPVWWPGFESAEILEPGDPDGSGRHVRVTVRSRLPVTLSFEVVGRLLRAPELLVMDATGELDGTGRWRLHQEGDVTAATYTWKVVATRPTMRVLEPWIRPLFVWNHHVLMGRGAVGLADHLGVRLVGVEAEPPVRARDWAPLVGLLAAVVVGLGLARRREVRHGGCR